MIPRQRAFVALGANLGEPIGVIEQAMARLAALDGLRMTARSSLYRTAPVGLLHQPDFINAVVALDFLGPVPPAPSFLAGLFAIEAEFGRQRSVRNAPRTLDLDLLLLGAQRLSDPSCTLPHPRLHERAFVLAPLLEIQPDLALPGLGPLALWLARCTEQRIERL